MATRLRDWDGVPDAGGGKSSPVWSVIRWHLKYWVFPVTLTTILYLLALGLGKHYATNGDLLGVATVMFITMFVILMIGYALGLVGIHYAYRFLRGQVGAEEEGKERGLSVADGFREMEAHKGAHKAFVHGVTTYAAIPFLVMIGLAWFSPNFVTKYGPALLFLSFPAVVLVTWLNPGKFIARMTQFLVIAVMVIIFGVAIWEGSQLKIGAYQREQAASAPVDQQAARRAKEEQLGYLRKQAADCSTDIAGSWKAGKPPSDAVQADCARKHQAVRDAEGGATTTSWSWSGSTSSAAGMFNQGGTLSAGPVGKRIEYDPAKVGGPITLGDFPAGNYRIVGEGERYQRFGRVDEPMNVNGQVRTQGGNTYYAPSCAPMVGPSGMLIAQSGGRTHKVDQPFAHPGGRIQGNVNNCPGEYLGSGSIVIWVETVQ